MSCHAIEKPDGTRMILCLRDRRINDGYAIPPAIDGLNRTQSACVAVIAGFRDWFLGADLRDAVRRRFGIAIDSRIALHGLQLLGYVQSEPGQFTTRFRATVQAFQAVACG